jgi:NAD(P)-dependent dehydrogenase (short-subunit alcohol dehydrogenase family)
MQEFAGKVAVVTGGASGIGFGMATRFAEEGMTVVLADIEEPALEAAVRQLRQREFEVLGVVTDVAKPESVETLAQKTIDAYGKVHVLCNNAGVGGGFGLAVWEATLKDWQWTLGVNLWGVIHGVRTFVPIMLEQAEDGHVVNTASSAGLTPGSRVYGVSKHAVVALSESLHDSLRQRGAKVSASVLCPGMINTRIMYGARNRPAELENEAPASDLEYTARDQVAKLAQETGMEPHAVGEIVLEAIRNQQFWVLTHDEFDETIRTRTEDILNRRNPTPIALPPGLRGLFANDDQRDR